MVVLSNNSYETKFLDAAKKGDLNRIKEMTSKKEKKVLISLERMDEIKDENGATALYWASRKGHLNIVQFFIANNAAANVNGKDKYGATALHAASWDGHVNVIEYLLDNGANVNQQNDSGSTALHYASSFRGKSKSAVLKLLLQNGADPYIPNKHNKTAIDLAKRAGGHDVIIQHIQQQQQQQQSSPDVNNTESTNSQPPNNTRQQPSSSSIPTSTTLNVSKHENDEPSDSMSIRESRNLLQHAIDHPESTDNISDLPYQYILNCTNNLADSNFIGGGTYGNVYLAKDPQLTMSHYFAVKVFDSANGNNKQIIRSFKKEAATLKRFRHPNIITLYGICNPSQDQDKFALVLEYANKGSLDSFLKDDASRARLAADTRISIMFQLARSIHFLHTGGRGGLNKVLHRDIKPSNICLTNNFQVKLIDCGLAKIEQDPNAGESQLGSVTPSLFTSGHHGPVGTRGYQCPRYERSNRYEEGSDVFSLGVVFAELIIGCLQGGQATRNGKVFGLMYDTFVKDEEEDELVVDGDEKLVEDADTAIVWNPVTLKAISLIAIECMAPTIKKRKKTLHLVDDLNRILSQASLLERTNENEESNDKTPNPSNAPRGRPVDDTDACCLCNRNIVGKSLKCSEGHETCGACADEHIFNHFCQSNDGTTSSSSSMQFRCCISGCQSKPFCNEDLRGVLSPEAFKVYIMQQNHHEQLQLFKTMQQEFSRLEPIQRGIQDNREMLERISNNLTRSVMMLSALTVEGSLLCPNLVWMVPYNNATFKRDPKKWFLQKTIRQTYKVVFICQHSWQFAHKPFEISVPRDWIVKVAPLLEIGLRVMKAVATAQNVPFPSIDMTKFRENVNIMQEFVDSVVLESDRMKIANAIHHNAQQQQNNVLLGDDDGLLCNVIGDGLKWLNEKANKTKNLKKWSDKIVLVPTRQEWGGGAFKWVKKEYKDIYFK